MVVSSSCVLIVTHPASTEGKDIFIFLGQTENGFKAD